MKALSINQPWAWLIVNGYKGVENRDWDTKYRGEFLVHAGKRIDHDAYDFIRVMGIDAPAADKLPTGGIVGKVNLRGTVHVKDRALLCSCDEPWFFGEYGFMLDGAEPCELVPCKGALGFFTPDYNSSYAIKAPKPKKSQPQTSLF